jgi:PAS domain S-box-containing protein
MLNRITFRLVAPLACVLVLIFGAVALLTVQAVSRFVQARQAINLSEVYGRDVSRTLSESYDLLAMSGKAADSGEFRIARARALGQVERLLRGLGLPGVVLDGKGEVLLSYGLAEPARLLGNSLEVGKTSTVRLDGQTRYVLPMEFPLWGLRVILLGNGGDAADFISDMAKLGIWAGMSLILALILFAFWTHRLAGRPARLIARSLRMGERPEYRGLEEFTILAESANRMMAGLEKREGLARLNQQWYRQVFDSAPVMMFTTDHAGKILEVNHLLATTAGIESEAMRSRPISEFLALKPKDAAKLSQGEALRRAKAKMTAFNGEEREVVLDLIPAVDRAGSKLFTGAVVDVTETQRTQQALIAAKETAMETYRLKSEFLANVSHEIRTPLNGVLGMLQLLGKTKLSQRQTGYVGNALDCGRALLALLGDILEYSSLEAGQAASAHEPFSPKDILEEVRQMFLNQAHAKGLSLEIVCGQAVPLNLIGDAGRLRQVLFNLTGNAVKFTPAGSVRITVEAVALDRQARACRLLFMVEDTGIGMPMEKLDILSEPFTQADGSHTRRYQGAGLGLAIVKRVVRLWGGALNFDSEPGLGTMILFTMPVHLSPVEDQESVPDTEILPAGKGRRVLLAEDDPINTVMTMDMLESLGYQTTIVDNGQDAVKALSMEDYDCLLMDIQMPQMDGMAATRAIRAAENATRRPHVPIIALTAHAMPGDRERFLAAGMDEYLAKPVEFENLAGVLSQAIAKVRRRRMS